MANAFIYGHGGRGKTGTATGTYVVPAGVEIYFFVDDGELLNGNPADVLAAQLFHGMEAQVQKMAACVKKEYDTVPDYVCLGDDKLKWDTGVYTVGVKVPKNSLIQAIPGGSRKRLSQIISGAGGKNAKVGNRIYWLCCREVLTGANSISYGHKADKNVAPGLDIAWTGQVNINDMGLKPSQVKKTGQWAANTSL